MEYTIQSIARSQADLHHARTRWRQADSLGTVAGRGSLQSHGQFDVVSERNRKIIAGRGPDAGKIFRAVIRVVGDDESTAAQATLKQREYRRIEALRPIEQNKIDRVGQVAGERFSLIKVFERCLSARLSPADSPKGVARIGSEQVCLPDWLLPRK